MSKSSKRTKNVQIFDVEEYSDDEAIPTAQVVSLEGRS